MSDAVLIVVGACAAFEALTIVFLVATFRVDRADWRDERRELLNRIRPETAQYAPVDAPESEAVPHMDDDDAYHRLRGET